jgi:hypothetical protein
MDHGNTEGPEDMEEGAGFRHGSEDLGVEDSEDNTQSMGRVRRNTRGPAHPGRSGSRVPPPSLQDLASLLFPRPSAAA